MVTRDAELGEKVRMLRNHGQVAGQRFVHHAIGLNSRFDEIQAAFQTHRYPGFPERLARRAEIAAYYTERFTPLAGRGVVPPPPDRDGRCFYVYTVLASDRDALGSHLAERGWPRTSTTRVPCPRTAPSPPTRHPVPDGPGRNRPPAVIWRCRYTTC